MTGIVALAVSRIQLSILDCDVRRVSHYDVVLQPQDALQLLGLLQSVDRRCPALLSREPRLMRHAIASAGLAVTVQQAIAGRNTNGPAWCLFEPLDATGMQRSDDEAEVGDGYGQGIKVHPGNSLKSMLGQYTRVGAR